MSDTDGPSVLRRKIGTARVPTAPGAMTAARAWHSTMPRVADEGAGLQLAVRAIQDRTQPLPDLLRDLRPATLIALLDKAGQGPALAILDAAFLTALIEVQMTGRVGTGAVADRMPTSTDAAICAALIDAWCAAFDEAAAPISPPPPCVGLRFAAHLADARAALLTLGEGEVRTTHLVLDLGAGSRQGTLTLAVPVAGLRVDAGTPQPLGRALGRVVMDSTARLEAVLHRVRLPYSAVRKMAPGDMVEVPLAALGAVSVEIRGGKAVARARLGQVEGQKAIRLDLASSPSRPTPRAFTGAAPAAGGSGTAVAPRASPPASEPSQDDDPLPG